MSEAQPQTPGTGKLGTNIEGLRSFGQSVAEHASTIAGLGIGGVFDQVAMPDSPIAQVLADAGSACESALTKVHQAYASAGDESVADSLRFEEHEQEHANSFRVTGERAQEVGDRARPLGRGL